MAKLEGTLAVTGLPPHRGLIVSLCFFRVGLSTDPAPYGGDPPAAAVTDCHEVFSQVDLNAESSQPPTSFPWRSSARPGSTSSRCGSS